MEKFSFLKFSFQGSISSTFLGLHFPRRFLKLLILSSTLRRLSSICESLVFTYKDPQHLFQTALFFFNLFILFIYFWQRWVFLVARGLSLVAVRGGYSSLWCAGFSLRWLLLLRSTRASVVVARGLSSCDLQALERRLSSCGSRA